MDMTHLDLFSGIGGFALAARWMNWETVQFVEIDNFCHAVLNKNFPNIPIHADIKTFDGTKYRGTVDILTGGFPCQPFSIAGKVKGSEDDRYLWPEMLRVIREVDAPIVVGENVANLKNVALEQILYDLENAGYWTEVYNIPARSVDADHERQRLWIIAHTKCERLQRYYTERKNIRINKGTTFTVDSNNYVFNGGKGLSGYRQYIRSDDGLSRKLDKLRVKALGNAIVPQIAHQIFKSISTI